MAEKREKFSKIDLSEMILLTFNERNGKGNFLLKNFHNKFDFIPALHHRNELFSEYFQKIS